MLVLFCLGVLLFMFIWEPITFVAFFILGFLAGVYCVIKSRFACMRIDSTEVWEFDTPQKPKKSGVPFLPDETI